MGMYDSFIKDEDNVAQLKCFNCVLMGYEIGDKVPVKEFGFPKTCTFCEWGGTSVKYGGKNIMGKKEPMGVFVVIKNGKLKDITEDENKVLKPVFDKYGGLLEEL